MLVVLALLALVVTLAAPELARPSDRLRLQAATRSVLAGLRTTRAAAVAANASVALTLDVDQRAFESPAVARAVLAPDLDIQLTVAEPERIDRARARFRFFADGSSTGGDVTLRLGSRVARICVDWLTGKAEEGCRADDARWTRAKAP